VNELEVVGRHQSFKAASEQARDLALRLRAQTQLRRTDEGWEVVGPPATNFRRSTPDGADPVHVPSREEHELAGEIAEDREDWARSEEDGWYYKDRDEEESDSIHGDSAYGRFQAPRDSSGRTLPSGSGW
jgi:hypothetical protein